MDRWLRDQVLLALDYVAARGPLKPLGTAIRWAFVFYLELSRDFAFVRASGMAYATLVALVPGLAVVLGVLQATGATDDPNGSVPLLLEQVFGTVQLEDGVPLSAFILEKFSGFDLAPLGVVGVVGLLVVASRLYLMVEQAYSDMFGVPVSRRPIGLRLLSFYFTITAAPVVLVLALNSSFRLATEVGVARFVGTDWLVLVLEYAVLVGALKLLPATTVRWRPALLGAFVSFVLIEGGRWGFGFYVAWVFEGSTLSRVYAQLAFVPVFLLWIYLLWVFALLGVEVAQVSQNFSNLVEKELELAEDRPVWPSVETALRVSAWVGWSFNRGGGPVAEANLVDQLNVDARDLVRVLDVLQECGVLVRTEEGWLLARPASSIQLGELAASFRHATGVGNLDDRLGEDIAKALALEGSLADGIERWLPAIGPAPSSGTAIG